MKIKNPVPRCSWELEHESVKLKTKLGQGAYGEVWKGKEIASKIHVAVKQNHMKNLTKDQIKEVMNEARIMRYVFTYY